jgi:hypothetical protein
MTEESVKPLKFSPDPDIGFNVVRRSDGGMHVSFTNADEQTLTNWREFALSHLIDSDRLTRNLYDLRALDEIPPEAIKFAMEVNSDPSARNIRMAVVVSNDTVRETVENIMAMTTFSSARIQTFTDLDEAEAWLSRPLNTMT